MPVANIIRARVKEQMKPSMELLERKGQKHQASGKRAEGKAQCGPRKGTVEWIDERKLGAEGKCSLQVLANSGIDRA